MKKPPEIVQAFARARFLIEVPLAQPWAAGETIASVHQRASREALERIEYLLERYGTGGVRVIGEPVIEQVIVTTSSNLAVDNPKAVEDYSAAADDPSSDA